MSNIRSFSRKWLIIFVLILASNILVPNECSAQIEQRIMIITGGHEFEREPFFDMFREMPGVEYQELIHPGVNGLYNSPLMEQFDVLLFYDMYQEIDDVQKAAFIKLLEKGKGVVFLHHSLASYQAWDEFEKIIGGRYIESGTDQETSTYQHDVEFTVQVADENHPITKGIKDFVIHDEVYGNFRVRPEVQPILETSHPESGAIIGWTNYYGKSRIVYIQPGHDHHGYENPDFQRLLKQALDWAQETQEFQMIRYSRAYKFKDGLYLNIEDLRANDPIPLRRIVTDLNSYNKDFFDEMIIKEEIILYDEAGVRASLNTRDVWGYALDGRLYIMLGGKFQRLNIEGSISHFIASATTSEKLKSAPPDSTLYSSPTQDAYRSFYRRDYYTYVTAEGKVSLFDFESNSLKAYNTVALGELLDRDPELSSEYNSLRKREKKKRMVEFIRKYNENHPLYFPDI